MDERNDTQNQEINEYNNSPSVLPEKKEGGKKKIIIAVVVLVLLVVIVGLSFYFLKKKNNDNKGEQINNNILSGQEETSIQDNKFDKKEVAQEQALNDSDNDGLDNAMEVEIYKTNPNNPDSDGDGYLDGEEVNNGYNPLGPGSISQNEGLKNENIEDAGGQEESSDNSFKFKGIIWKVNIGEKISSSDFVIYNNVIFFPSEEGNYYAVSADTGKKIWEYDTGDDYPTKPAVTDKMVYFGGGKGLYAINRLTGKEEWIFSKGDRARTPTVTDNTVYFGTYIGFYALDAESGNEKWNVFHFQGVDIGTPLTDNNSVYYLSYGNLLRADILSGEKKWEFATGVIGNGSPEIYNNKIYITGFRKDENYLFVVDLNTGEELDNIKISPSHPLINNGISYIGSSDKIYAIDLNTKKVKWENNISHAGRPVLSGKIIYATAAPGTINAFDINTGEELDSYFLKDGYYNLGTPVINNENIIITDNEGNLYLIN